MKFTCPQNHTFTSNDDPAACPDCGWLMSPSEGEPEPLSPAFAKLDSKLEEEADE